MQRPDAATLATLEGKVVDINYAAMRLIDVHHGKKLGIVDGYFTSPAVIYNSEPYVFARDSRPTSDYLEIPLAHQTLQLPHIRWDYVIVVKQGQETPLHKSVVKYISKAKQEQLLKQAKQYEGAALDLAFSGLP